jgi:hypothetical protein
MTMHVIKIFTLFCFSADVFSISFFIIVVNPYFFTLTNITLEGKQPMSNDLKIVSLAKMRGDFLFVDIGGIVGHHYLNFLVITYCINRFNSANTSQI